jgi:hypothetical protein
VDVRNGLVSSALVAAKERPGIIVMFANFGTMTPPKTFITAMIVVYAGKAEVLEKTFSIARCVLSSGFYDYLTHALDMWHLHVHGSRALSQVY